MRIAHLRGREKELEPLGWSGAEAEWIALVCLHSGIFTRAQFGYYFNSHRWTAGRFVQALVERGSAEEPDTPRFSGGGRACWIFDKRIYRALGIENIRHRRKGTFEVTLRRLLSLDYVLEYPNLVWLPTEPEKVACFDGLGIDRALIPGRVYKGKRSTRKRFFALKLPVAVDSETATFVYVDPGHETESGIRSWGITHRRLWNAIRAKGIPVRVVAITRTREARARAGQRCAIWTRTTPRTQNTGMTAKEEIEHIKRAIIDNDQAVLDSYGGLNPAYGRKEELARNSEQHVGDGVSITDYRAICSRRVQVLENGSGAEAEDKPEGTWRVETA